MDDPPAPPPPALPAGPVADTLQGLAPRILDQITNGVVVTDAEGTIEYVNPAFMRMTGYGWRELVGRNPRILQSGEQAPAFYRQMWDELVAGRPVLVEFRNRRADGSVYIQKSSISPVMDGDGALRYVGIAEDITRRRALEDQVQRSLQLESLGRFTSSIAHDFNNVLAVISASLDFLAMDLDPGSGDEAETLELVDEALGAVDRGADLVRRLMDYARSQPSTSRPHDMQQVLEKSAGLIRRLLPESVEFETDLDVSGRTVCLDPAAFDQVLLNLATNARDAMGPRGGRILMAAQLRETASDHCLLTPPHLHLRFTDNGSGMPPSVVEKIFDPFFTTKPVGKGTGLGLAGVHSVVDGLGGTISVESRVDEGTTFHLCLPLLSVDAPAGAEPARREGSVRRQGRLLLVEDSGPVRRAARRALESMGYSVLAVPDAEKALVLLAGGPRAFDAVVTDVVLPRTSGAELYARLDPSVRPPFVFVTGHIQGQPSLPEDVPVIRKPWRVEELSALLEQILDTR